MAERLSSLSGDDDLARVMRIDSFVGALLRRVNTGNRHSSCGKDVFLPPSVDFDTVPLGMSLRVPFFLLQTVRHGSSVYFSRASRVRFPGVSLQVPTLVCQVVLPALLPLASPSSLFASPSFFWPSAPCGPSQTPSSCPTFSSSFLLHLLTSPPTQRLVRTPRLRVQQKMVLQRRQQLMAVGKLDALLEETVGGPIWILHMQ